MKLLWDAKNERYIVSDGVNVFETLVEAMNQ